MVAGCLQTDSLDAFLFTFINKLGTPASLSNPGSLKFVLLAVMVGLRDAKCKQHRPPFWSEKSESCPSLPSLGVIASPLARFSH